ncbi:hypothetical protein QBC41DRAFT_150436 [Cercophora samala]|uniref:Uncharacterized protein n=1 Tax=Cercophora samala TaxID=330535 RepID=A0AA39Z8V9_9PEZI|nr:hypothetical protein QBC41DRAFT_150436 [Cercophora samala]
MSNVEAEPVINPQAGNAATSPQLPEPLWITIIKENKYLHDDSSYENTIAPHIAQLFQEYLLSDDESSTAATALKFDSMYEDLYLPNYNGRGNGRKKGWTGYLSYFYETVFVIAKHIPYNDPLQDKVIQLLLELKKLPSRATKIGSYEGWEWIDSTVWQCDPQFIGQLGNAHDSAPPSWTSEGYLSSGSSYEPEEYEEAARECEIDPLRWVNYHALRARCILAGLYEGYEGYLDGPSATISYVLGPEEERYPGDILDVTVMAACNYILMIGDIIDSECVQKQQPPYRYQWKCWEDGNGPAVWKQWARRLSEIIEDLEKGNDSGLHIREKNRDALQELVTKARARMAELEPALVIDMEAERVREAKKRLDKKRRKE